MSHIGAFHVDVARRLDTAAITGTRKPQGRDLADVQRACNTAINRLRAAVERSIAHLVNWKVLDLVAVGKGGRRSAGTA